MKVILKFIIIIMITISLNIPYFDFEHPENESKTILFDNKRVKYKNYDVHLLKEYNLIINNKEEFETFLTQLEANNSNRNEIVDTIKEDYKKIDFKNKNLIVIDASGSGCTSNINNLDKITKDGSTIIVKLKDKVIGDTCMIFWDKIYIIEIEKGNYNKIIINND